MTDDKTLVVIKLMMATFLTNYGAVIFTAPFHFYFDDQNLFINFY